MGKFVITCSVKFEEDFAIETESEEEAIQIALQRMIDYVSVSSISDDDVRIDIFPGLQTKQGFERCLERNKRDGI